LDESRIGPAGVFRETRAIARDIGGQPMDPAEAFLGDVVEVLENEGERFRAGRRIRPFKRKRYDRYAVKKLV
jgi:hypothetical protein